MGLFCIRQCFLTIAWNCYSHWNVLNVKINNWSLPFSMNNDYFQDRKCVIQMCQFSFVLSYHADVLFMFVESFFYPFTSKYQTAKCICPNCQMYFSFEIAKCICHADVLFMFVESLFHPFRSKYLRRKLWQTGLYFKEG